MDTVLIYGYSIWLYSNDGESVYILLSINFLYFVVASILVLLVYEIAGRACERRLFGQD